MDASGLKFKEFGVDWCVGDPVNIFKMAMVHLGLYLEFERCV